jgi:MFS family permease
MPIRLVILLAVAIFINYVDRGTLATAAPLLEDDLHFSPAQMGILLSAFFWTYTPTQLAVGWAVERFGARWLLAGGVALWSLATLTTGFVGTFTQLLLLRLLLGFGESVVFPCSSSLLARNVAIGERGRSNAAIAVGIALGPAIGTFLGGIMMANGNWRIVFIAFGLASLLWVLPWLTLTTSAESGPAPKQGAAAPGWGYILGHRSAWGAAIGHFSSNYALYFVLSWLPAYLVKERGFSMTAMAQTGLAIYLLQAGSAAGAGWLLDRFIARGLTANRVYKTAMSASLLTVSICFVGCALGSSSTALICLLIAGAMLGIGSSGIFAIAQTLAGPRAAGRWVGFQNCFANLAGIFAPAVTGVIVQQTHSFAGAFVLAAAISVVGAIGWGAIIRAISPIEWETRQLGDTLNAVQLKP